MKIQLLFIPFLILFLFNSIDAQDFKPSSSFGAKLLVFDYHLLNGESDLGLTNGIELIYLRDISKRSNVAFPFRIGAIKVPEDINNRNVVGIDGLFQYKLVPATKKLIPYLSTGVGILAEESAKANFQVPFGGGLSLRIGDQSFINGHGEYRYSSNENRMNMQLGFGYIYRFVKIDTDKDGVADHMDKCPDVAGLSTLNGCPDQDGDNITDAEDLCPLVPGRRATNGCPDQDKDGVPDGDDACPDEPGDAKNGCPDSDGDGVSDADDKCPETIGIIALNGCPDSDGDGVSDIEDECPDERGIIANGGCPSVDFDNDGVEDDMDLCPEQPGDKATQGCPDRDKDGVADKDDRCPDKPGPFSGCPDTDGDGVIDADDGCPDQAGPSNNNGCPNLNEAEKEVLEFAKRAVQFQTGKAVLLAESYTILDQIVQIMNRYPGYKLKISGHTDDIGNEVNNQFLSERRAKACFDRLVASGITESRISFFGFGETQPVASNDTVEGRRLNRRVEFELYTE